jgi:non-specific serine/threonine protein kinase/serine/threonine-protein kinase
MDALANTYKEERKYAQAEDLFTQALEGTRGALGPENPHTLEAMVGLAGAYREERKYGQAEALLTQVLEIRRRVLGPEHRDTLLDLIQLAETYYFDGDYPRAEPLYRQALESCRRALVPDDPLTLSALENLGSTLSHEGRYDEADKMYREAIRSASQAQQENLWYNFACAAAVAGRRDDALDHISRAIDNGFVDADWLEQDDDLKSLRGAPRFEALVAKAREAAAKPR